MAGGPWDLATCTPAPTNTPCLPAHRSGARGAVLPPAPRLQAEPPTARWRPTSQKWPHGALGHVWGSPSHPCQGVSRVPLPATPALLNGRSSPIWSSRPPNVAFLFPSPTGLPRRPPGPRPPPCSWRGFRSTALRVPTGLLPCPSVPPSGGCRAGLHQDQRCPLPSLQAPERSLMRDPTGNFMPQGA